VLGHALAWVLDFPTRYGQLFEYEDPGLGSSLWHRIEAGKLAPDDSPARLRLACWNGPASRRSR
jgi:hypothetical protein